MSYVPAGEFLYHSGEFTQDVVSQHETLPAYCIDQYEASKNFGKPLRGYTYQEAVVYCLDLGKRLPTEKEWMKAARGPNGYNYGTPNGTLFFLERDSHDNPIKEIQEEIDRIKFRIDTLKVRLKHSGYSIVPGRIMASINRFFTRPENRLTYTEQEKQDFRDEIDRLKKSLKSKKDELKEAKENDPIKRDGNYADRKLRKVDFYPPNLYGVYSTTGGLWEYVQGDVLREITGLPYRPVLLKGGSYMTNNERGLHIEFQNWTGANSRSDSIGFRCVADPLN